MCIHTHTGTHTHPGTWASYRYWMISASIFKFEGIERLFVVEMGFPGGTVIKKPPSNAGDVRNADLTLRLRRSPGGGNGNPD